MIIIYLQRTGGETVALSAAEDAEFFHTLNQRRNGVGLRKCGAPSKKLLRIKKILSLQRV